MMGVEIGIFGVKILVQNSIAFILPSQSHICLLQNLSFKRCRAVHTLVQTVNLKCIHKAIFFLNSHLTPQSFPERYG